MVRLAEAQRVARVPPLRQPNKSAAGFPDLVLVKAGVMIAAELKCEDVKTMPLAQTRWLAELSCVPGVRAVLWQPKDAEKIIRQLEGVT